MKYIKIYEDFIRESYSKQEYVQEIQTKLKERNIRPIELNKLIEFYDNEITKRWEEGETTDIFIKKIVKDLELDSGGFLAQKMGSGGWNQKTTLKYL